MPPPAGGGLVLSNEHDNGKTCREFYRKISNINRLNLIANKIAARLGTAGPHLKTHEDNAGI